MLSTPAHAVEGRLDGGGSDTVIVWKSKEAHDKGMNLIIDGVHKRAPEVVVPYVACFVRGTRAVTISVGWITHDVMVIEGKAKGCEGNIAAERLKATR